MRRSDFLKELKRQLEFLNRQEQEEVVEYYDELIQDALDHGETEREFIDSLGDVTEIAYNIKKDGTFLEKVRAKTPFSVREAFGLTVRIIGYFFFAIFTIVILSIAFSFTVSGVSMIGGGLFSLVAITSIDINFIILRLSLVLLGVGILIFGIGLFKWYFDIAKRTLQKVLRRVRELFQ